MYMARIDPELSGQRSVPEQRMAYSDSEGAALDAAASWAKMNAAAISAEEARFGGKVVNVQWQGKPMGWFYGPPYTRRWRIAAARDQTPGPSITFAAMLGNVNGFLDRSIPFWPSASAVLVVGPIHGVVDQ